ncbi:MAG: ABC transporter substrate-binding protein [Deltaproteobacteria bacterium]|nr:ABC transporter substrate-binding protein [Deltaproteobacteria bacterium]
MRIVSLAPSITETLFAVGAGAEVVAVSDLSDFPPEARSIERVGSYMKPNVEAVIAHRPDLVIAVPSPGNREAVEGLMALGLRVLVVEEGPTIGDILGAIGRIADECERHDAGRVLVERLRERVAAVRRRVAPLPRPRVLMVVGENPLVAVGDDNLLAELLREAGADNVASGLGRWPRLSVEFVVKSAPQVVIDSSMGDEASADLSFYAGLGIEAVRRGRLHAVRLDEVLRPGPRIGEGLEKLARLLHPRAFGEPAPAARPAGAPR